MSAEEQAAIPDTAPPIVSEQKVKDSSRQKPKKLDVQIPYVGSPGAIKTALDRIRQASTPERVSVDFVNTILKMKGGSGNVIAPFLKKIGLVESDGRPTNLYKGFGTNQQEEVQSHPRSV